MPLPAPNPSHTTACQALEDWLAEEDAITGLSPNTLSGHRQHALDTLHLIAAHAKCDVKALPVTDLTRANIVTALAAYRRRPDQRYTTNPLAAPKSRSDVSMVRRMSVLSRFCQWCVTTGYLTSSPIAEIERPKPGKRLPKALSEPDARKVLAAAEESAWPERDVLLVRLALGAGLRRAEIASVQLADLRGTPVTQLRVRHGKGDKERLVGVTPATSQAVVDYLPSRAALLIRWGMPDAPELLLAYRPRTLKGVVNLQGEPVQSIGLTTWGVHDIVKRIMARAGVAEPGRAAHSLRHSCATLSLRSGSHNLRQLQSQMGHNDLATLSGYLEVTDEELIAAAARHPLG